MNAPVKIEGMKPFSLANEPSLIERVWPAQKISVEAQKERKAGRSQTLTALGSYWKGRKPLFLVRACVLGALLPATEDVERDLAIFEKLCGIDVDQAEVRLRTLATLDEILTYGSPAQIAALTEEVEGRKLLRKLPREERTALMAGVVSRMPFSLMVDKLWRPEEIDEERLTGPVIAEANRHIGTSARTLAELVHQLGVARFGRTPKIGDVFCGGGSIPFESARIGCDAYASDLNPIACLLTWGALNIIGAGEERREVLEAAQTRLLAKVDEEITTLG